MKDLYNLVYFLTIGAWDTTIKHLTGKYHYGAGIGSGVGDSIAILFSYGVVLIEILISVILYLI